MKLTYFHTLAVAFGLLLLSRSAQGSSLTFEIFDPTLYSVSEGFPEGFRISSEYGGRVSSTTAPASNGTTMFEYGVGAEGSTPNVIVYYGPYSIFTGGPELWRYDYGDLDRVLYQGSRHADPANPLGNNYDVLEITFVADPGYDVLLHGFDLGGWQANYTIDAVTVFDGIPFPFLTPTNQIFEETNVLAEGAESLSHTEFDFGVLPDGTLQAHVIWLRIDASNLGSDSELIGIDNIRFGQIASDNFEEIDPADIEAALQQGQVPEASSLVMCLLGGTCGAMVYARRRPYAIG